MKPLPIFVRSVLLTLFVLLGAVIAPAAIAQTSQARPSTNVLFADIIPSLSGEIEQEYADALPVYHVVGSLVPASEQPARIEGKLTLDFVNFTEVEQAQIYLAPLSQLPGLRRWIDDSCECHRFQSAGRAGDRGGRHIDRDPARCADSAR